GKSQPTMGQHDMSQFERRWQAFGWRTIVIDGHDIAAILDAFETARATKGQPTMILARTEKGKGVSFTEGKENWHGKAFKKEELEKAVAELEQQIVPGVQVNAPDLVRTVQAQSRPEEKPKPVVPPNYKIGDHVA